jgi:hypothetical protein
MDNLECGREAGELRHRVAQVDDQKGNHQVEGHLDAELLTQQVREPLTGDDTQTRRHLLNDEQRERDRYDRPQQAVPVDRPRERVRRDPASVVVHVRRDHARPHDRRKHDQPAPVSLEPLPHVSLPSLSSPSRSQATTSSTVTTPSS